MIINEAKTRWRRWQQFIKIIFQGIHVQYKFSRYGLATECGCVDVCTASVTRWLGDCVHYNWIDVYTQSQITVYVNQHVIFIDFDKSNNDCATKNNGLWLLDLCVLITVHNRKCALLCQQSDVVVNIRCMAHSSLCVHRADCTCTCTHFFSMIPLKYEGISIFAALIHL